MVKKISFKGVIIGAIIDIIGTNFGVLILLLWAVLYMIHRWFTPSADVIKIFIQHNTLFKILSYIFGGFFSIFWWYISARIAKHNELLNGCLSSFLCVLLGIIWLRSSMTIMSLLGLIISPTLWLMGGYLYLLHKHKFVRQSKTR